MSTTAEAEGGAKVSQLHPPVAGDDVEEPTGVVESELAHDTPEEPKAEAEPKPTPPMQVPLPGDFGKTITTEFGGRDPDKSEIRLLGGKMPIEGSFAKGTILDLHVRVKVSGVLGQDTNDDFGETQHTTRRHMAHMISVKRLS